MIVGLEKKARKRLKLRMSLKKHLLSFTKGLRPSLRRIILKAARGGGSIVSADNSTLADKLCHSLLVNGDQGSDVIHPQEGFS